MHKLRSPKSHPNLQAQYYRRAESPAALSPGQLMPQQQPPSAAFQNVTLLLFFVLQSLLSLHISHTNRFPRTIPEMGEGSWWPLEIDGLGFQSGFAKYQLLRLGLFTYSKPWFAHLLACLPGGASGIQAYKVLSTVLGTQKAPSTCQLLFV